MIRPDIKTTHEDRFRHLFVSPANRRDFLGKSPLHLLIGKPKKPATNIKRQGPHFEMEIALSGFSKEEIFVTVFDNILTIRGEKEKKEKPKSQYIVQEFDIDIVERQFELAKGIGHEHIEAIYKDGILKLTFTDVPTSKSKTYRKVKVS